MTDDEPAGGHPDGVASDLPIMQQTGPSSTSSRSRTSCGSCRPPATPTWSTSTRARPRSGASRSSSARPGCRAHLAGAVAARTVLPVIGVPIASRRRRSGWTRCGHRADAARRAGRDRRVDGAMNAAILAAADHRRGRRGGPGRLRKFKDDLGGGPEAVIDRYDVARDDGRLVGRGPARALAPHRGPGGEAWARLGADPRGRRARDPSKGRRSTSRRVPRSNASPTTTWPRSSRSSGSRSAREGAGCTSA